MTVVWILCFVAQVRGSGVLVMGGRLWPFINLILGFSF